MLTLPLKWHGGKGPLVNRIIDLMPPRCKNPNAPTSDDPGWLHYVEPYFGGGAVLLANDPEGISEVVNDIDSQLTNFWLVLKDQELFGLMIRELEASSFNQTSWLASAAYNKIMPLGKEKYVEHAIRFFILCRQSLSGRMKSFAGITRARTRRGMNEQVSAWLNAIEGLPEVHARLKRVLILNKPALEVIRSEDGPRTLFYLDPPYLHETRATTDEYGENEMSEHDHSQLLNKLVSVKCSGGSLEGRFLLSGYRSGLYDDYAEKFCWSRHDFEVDNKAAGGKTKRRMVECVWTNY